MSVFGKLNPGDPTTGSTAGKLISEKSVAFNTGSTFAVDLNGLTVATQYDQLLLNGTAAPTISSGSTLSITLGFAPALNNGFRLIDLLNGSITGTFANLSNGGTITAVYNGNVYTFTGYYTGANAGDGNDLTLVTTAIAPVPEPVGLGLVAVGAGALLRRRRTAC